MPTCTELTKRTDELETKLGNWLDKFDEDISDKLMVKFRVYRHRFWWDEKAD